MTPEQEKLYEDHRAWLPIAVRSICKRMPDAIRQMLDDDEMEQCSEIGLWKAAGKWQPTMRASFKVYAQSAIQNTILSEIRRKARNDTRNFVNVLGPELTEELMEGNDED